MSTTSRPWLDAWADAAHGPEGFWRSASPRDHFRTASTSTSVLGALLAGLLAEHPQIRCVVELGAGDGLLLHELADRRPDLDLAGVDLRDRPPTCPDSVAWCRGLWDVRTGGWSTEGPRQLFERLAGPTLVVCAEWLDDLPCPVAVRTTEALRLVEVDTDGRERPGDRPGAEWTDWATRWSPWSRRLEIGSTRDRAWSWVCEALRPFGGLALLIDYGHLVAARPPGGSLTAYRAGRPAALRPSPDVNLTAAVAIDSVAAAGHRAGALTLLQARQSHVVPHQPDPTTRPPDVLADLVSRTEHAALRSPSLWGDHWWLLQQIPPTTH